jgi:hypothetical protein
MDYVRWRGRKSPTKQPGYGKPLSIEEFKLTLSVQDGKDLSDDQVSRM